MNVLKIVCGGLGAVMLTAGSIWAFAEPAPPPMTATPLAACSAGNCGANACPASKCDSAVTTVSASCQNSACPTTAKTCCDKTVPVAVTKSKCQEGACPASAKTGCKSKCDADKTIPVAVTDACCKAESACVTKSACKSSKCDGQADGCDGECCKVGTCESACCDDKENVSADACPAAKKDCCDKTIPVAVTKSECKEGTCPVSVKAECAKPKCCHEKVSADACPAAKKNCCDKTIPVAVKDSKCEDGTCPVSAKSCCESKCAAKDKNCDGECCKAGTCKAACCEGKKVSAGSCPSAKKDCCDKTIPVAVTESECKEGSCPVCTKAECGKAKCCHEKVSADACPSAKKDCCDKTIPVAVTKSECAKDKNGEEKSCKKGTCESDCRDKVECEKSSADALPPIAAYYYDPTLPVAVTKSECQDGACPVSAKSCCESKCAAKDKNCDGKCCKAGTCKAACCDEREEVSTDACPATKKECCDKTTPVAVTESDCKSGACPVCTKTACKTACEKSECSTTKVAACSACGKDGCTAEKCSGIDACETKCQGEEKCSSSDGCEAACPASREPVTAETPGEQPQASRTIRLQINSGHERPVVVRVVQVSQSPVAAAKPSVHKTSHCGVVNGTGKIAAALFSASIKTTVPTVQQRHTAPVAEQAPPSQPPEPTHFVELNREAALYPVASGVISSDEHCSFAEECPHACPLEAHHHAGFVNAELGPPSAHFAYPAPACPLCAHGHPAMHPPAFHPHHPEFAGPPPGYIHLEFNEIPAPPPVPLHGVVGPVVVTESGVGPLDAPVPPPARHHGPMAWVGPPPSVFGPPMVFAGPRSWGHHPRLTGPEPAPHHPLAFARPFIGVGVQNEECTIRGHMLHPDDAPPSYWTTMAVGADDEESIVRTHVQLHMAPSNVTWGELPPRTDHVHPAPPRVPVQKVSFDGDAPAPGIHPTSRPSAPPIAGTWIQQSDETTVRFTCEPSRIQGTATFGTGEEESTSVEFSGTCSTTPDGQLFGVIDHLSINITGEESGEIRQFESKMVDQPFAIRFRTDGQTLYVKDFKCAGLDDPEHGQTILNASVLGKYTRDTE